MDLKLNFFLWDETSATFPEMDLVSIRAKRLLVSRLHFGVRLPAPSLVNSSMQTESIIYKQNKATQVLKRQE